MPSTVPHTSQLQLPTAHGTTVVQRSTNTPADSSLRARTGLLTFGKRCCGPARDGVHGCGCGSMAAAKPAALQRPRQHRFTHKVGPSSRRTRRRREPAFFRHRPVSAEARAAPRRALRALRLGRVLRACGHALWGGRCLQQGEEHSKEHATATPPTCGAAPVRTAVPAPGPLRH